MYLDRESTSVDRKDDWSQFGLTREGDSLYGPDSSLEKYMEYRKKLKGKRR